MCKIRCRHGMKEKLSKVYLAFVEKVTLVGSKDFVEPEFRIATFDNDGTLWVEKPLLAQLAFYKRELLDAEVLKDKRPWFRFLHWCKSIVWNFFDLLKRILAYFHSGLTTEEYRQHVSRWISQVKHPRFNRLYTELTYQPMIELWLILRRFRTAKIDHMSI